MAVVAVWPVTVVTGAGYAVAWLRGWPAARLGRQAGWALPMSAVWIAAESARGWRAITLNPVRDGASGWPHLTVATVVRTFLLVAPVTIPTGLALAALLWAWRVYAITTGTGGSLASAPLTFDARRWKRQVQDAGPGPAASLPAALAPVILPAAAPRIRRRRTRPPGDRDLRARARLDES